MHKSILFISLIFFAGSLWDCANQTTPMGGPKDTIPPVLIKSIPAHKQKNYNGKSIELTFNEYIVAFNPKDEILISPSIGKEIEYKVKKNTITITPKYDWQENTTYTISIREGIKDITENNPPENLRIAFSTGNTIDSLAIFGTLSMALKETVPEKITVAVYEADTFDIFQHTPSYFTISNKKGQFSLENLKHGNYRLYAFDDKNKNLKVESRTEKFGFLNKTIIPDQYIDSLQIRLVNLDTRAPKLNSMRNNGLYTRLSFNKYLDKYNITFADLKGEIHSYGSDQTEIVIYNPSGIKDSVAFQLHGIDSVQQLVDTTLYIKNIEPSFIPEDFAIKSGKLKYNIKENTLIQSFQLSKPLASITYDSVFIQADSAFTLPITPADFTYDSIHKTLNLSKHIPYDTLFKNPDFTKRGLILNKASFISIENDSSKASTTPVPQVKPEQTGTLLVKAETQNEHFIVQLLSTTGEIIEEVKNVKEHSFLYLAPQNYKIRIILDINNNGRWDAGNIFNNEEPEPIVLYKTAENKYEVPIRANWELGPLLLKF